MLFVFFAAFKAKFLLSWAVISSALANFSLCHSVIQVSPSPLKIHEPTPVCTELVILWFFETCRFTSLKSLKALAWWWPKLKVHRPKSDPRSTMWKLFLQWPCNGGLQPSLEPCFFSLLSSVKNWIFNNNEVIGVILVETNIAQFTPPNVDIIIS